jgi:hypothetical protein
MTIHPVVAMARRDNHPLTVELLRSLAEQPDLRHARKALHMAADAVEGKAGNEDQEVRFALSRANYDDQGLYTLYRGEQIRLTPLEASTIMGAWCKAVAGFMVRKG